jgi:A-macroglobulin TED domain
VLTTFFSVPGGAAKYADTVRRATNFLTSKLNSFNTYTLALATYVLALKNDIRKDEAFQMLEAKAQTALGLKWWNPVAGSTTSKADSLNVEITAYAMLAYLELGHDLEAAAIFKWLTKNAQATGGFFSTQSTVVGIAAMAKYAERVRAETQDMTIVATYGFKREQKTITINQANALNRQHFELPSAIGSVGVSANGKGIAVVHLGYRYTSKKLNPTPAFNLDVIVSSRSKVNFLSLDLSASYIVSAGSTASNMVIIEVNLPSGYVYDHNTTPILLRTVNVSI